MKDGVDLKRLRDLVRLFDGLRLLHDELFCVIESKIEAMRHADVAAIQAAAESEQVIVTRLKERDGFRNQLMEAIGQDLKLSAKAARALTVSQLAARLPEPERSLVVNAASKLQAVMAKSAQANRLAATVAREVVRHMKWVFAAVRPADAAPIGYTGRGLTVAIADASLFEAVG
ncbi:MAG: flagellar export chaperone FlgN [Planctomycetota bacterium]